MEFQFFNPSGPRRLPPVRRSRARAGLALKLLKETRPSLLVAAAATLLLCAATSCLPPGLLRSQLRDRGGIFLVVAVKSDAPQAVERTMRVMGGRCERLGVYCEAEREGGADASRFRLRVSGAQDAGRAKAVLLSEGMELRPVVSPLSPAPIKTYPTRAEAESAAGASNDVLPFVADQGRGSFLVVERAAIVTGDDVREAHPFDLSTPDYPGDYEIMFGLKPDGAHRFGDWTAGHIGSYLAIVLDGEVRSAPFIKSRIDDRGIINGRFSKQQADDISLVLSTGNLPAPVEVVQEGKYEP